MNAAAFLSELRRRDIVVRAVDGQLHCTAKAGALTPELREELRSRKDDILAALASAQALAVQDRAIVPLQASGSRIPVFAVPGHNGDVFCYRALAQRLGEDQPFYGLQPPGVDGHDQPLVRVEEISACFARQIQAFAGFGPYVIAGYCAGGSVAFELAQQLLRAGARVSLLALFASPYPAHFRWPSQLRLRLSRQVERVASLGRELLLRSPDDFRRYLAGRLERRRERIKAEHAAANDPVLKLRGKVERATLTAVRAYTPLRYEGPVALFLPSRQWREAEPWRAAAPLTRQYFGPNGCAAQDMLREPHAPAVADLFKRVMPQ